MAARESFAIDIAGRWSLEDLYIFPRAFEQVYFLLYSLNSDLSDEELERISHAYGAFPWQGGYSAVGFYDQIKYTTPVHDRPRVVSIEYHSPGFIELQLITDVATSVGILVATVAASIKIINSTYNGIIRDLQKRKLLRLDVQHGELKLAKDQLEIVKLYSQYMANAMELSDLQEINDRTGHPYRSMKIILSLFRRVRTLVEYTQRGKARIPTQPRLPRDNAD